MGIQGGCVETRGQRRSSMLRAHAPRRAGASVRVASTRRLARGGREEIYASIVAVGDPWRGVGGIQSSSAFERVSKPSVARRWN